MTAEAAPTSLDASDTCIRVVPGPREGYFTTAAFGTLFAEPHRVSAASDKMGHCLDGPRLQHRQGHDVVSDGIARGAIQVPGDGLPIVLMADRQPTGGYPKFATVIKADLLAQTRPCPPITFRPMSIEAVVAPRRAATRMGPEIRSARRSLSSIDLPLLASGNCASGFANASGDEPNSDD